MTRPSETPFPRRRGFNLLGMFTEQRPAEWSEREFAWIAEWGFDFVRLPMSYCHWVECGTDGESPDPFAIREEGLAQVDQAVELAGRFGLHANLNLHRAPGYTVRAKVREPGDLWTEAESLEAFRLHWRTFAERYRGIPSERVSFNLVNEPPAPSPDGMTRADHERVVRATVAAIREADPDREIWIDGLHYGNEPCAELADLGVGQSCRAYQPLSLTHRGAWWVGGEDWPEPTWPGRTDTDTTHASSVSRGERWDRARLEAFYQPWIELAAAGTPVHCGEGGFYNRTPHDVGLRWLRDVLEILTAADIGWALWNLRGPFGVLDSQRDDVDYEDFHGCALDRKMLDLLREH